MNRLILGIDAGNYKAKVAGPYGIDTYRTAICPWVDRNIFEIHGEDDMDFKIDGEKGLAGTVAVYEDEFGGGGMYGDSKAHKDTKIRVLLAIYRYTSKYCPGIKDISLVTGNPIVSHTEKDKNEIIEMLKGSHQYTVNGETININIRDAAVGAEGVGAYWSNPEMGMIRIIDIGSGTVNCGSIIDGKFVNSASSTFNYGMETVNSKDLQIMARAIIRNTTRLKWNKNDVVLICGGIAQEIYGHIAQHYVNSKLLQPILKNHNGVVVCEPVYANAVGFYELAKAAFG